MSYSMVLGALLTVLVVVGGISALFWWVRRPVGHVRSRIQQPLPLFSHARASVYMREDEDDLDGTTGELIATRADANGRHAASVPSWSAPLPDATAPSAPRGAYAARPAVHRIPVTPAATAQPSVQFSIPTDATLQFLPGRLEILTGSEQGREIRFVRLPGDSETCITFGRRTGAAYRHVQLRDATVSREHAKLTLRGGEWRLLNHSATNPVQVNGVELATSEEVAMHDGDRVEMGEVTFRFRR